MARKQRTAASATGNSSSSSSDDGVVERTAPATVRGCVHPCCEKVRGLFRASSRVTQVSLAVTPYPLFFPLKNGVSNKSEISGMKYKGHIVCTFMLEVIQDMIVSRCSF